MKNAVTLLSVCGLCAAVSTAQVGRVVNISGATLLENYVKAPASTNDYIDVDGNGVAGALGSFSVQQLAQGGPSGDPGQYFVVQYRVTGSVNGFIELTRFGRPTFVTTDSFDINGILGAAPAVGPANPGVATAAYVNRVLYINNGVRAGAYNAGNPGGFPVRSTSTTNAFGIYAFPDTSALGGSAIDIAPLDVSTVWAVRKGATTDAQWAITPLLNGYGRNPRVSTNKTGGLTGAGLSSQLASLNGRNLFNPSDAGSANSNTIFDQELAFAAIAPVINPGTAIRRVTMTELQHLFGTGRAVTGENLMVVTRDVGSGTRNAFENCIGQDPSWGVGDNIGSLSTTTAQNNLGAAFLPTNKGSNGGMEATLRNARLGIGYVGTERGVTGSGSGSWLTSGALEIADVANNIYAGWTPGTYVRPTTTNIVNNSGNGWLIGGQAVLATIGDPLAEPAALGGTGAATPRMSNAGAAAYMNNIRQSIAAFVTLPTDPENFGMPGEFAATQFLLLNALDRLHTLSVPTNMIANPNFNLNLKNYTISNNVHNNPLFASYNTATAGRAPTRTALAVGTYSDGVALGANYVTQGLTNVSNGSVLTQRNKIAGDFSGNGVRDVNDATQMVAAWRQRSGGPVWSAPTGTGSIAGAPGSDAVIEILGDFDGDGSFTTADVRYFADGLAMNAGQLDRAAGFQAIDVAFGGNFFGTTLPSNVGGPRIYKNGDSRADVAGAAGITRGFAPTGFNGIVNAADIDYIVAQYLRNPAVSDGALNWSNLDEAVYGDLSCDMNSDLIVDRSDVTNLLQGVLCTRWWDVNLDGSVDATDRAIAMANLGNAGGWAIGDVDGDGIVSLADVALICSADFNGDGTTDFFDYLDFVDAFSAGACHADFNGDSTIDFFDYLDFVDAFSAGC